MSDLSQNVYSMMQSGAPYASYIKTILGKVQVTILDSFDEKPKAIILYGDPKAEPTGCIVDVWNEKEDMFFKRANRIHFERGILMKFNKKEKPVEKSPNEFSDDEIIELLDSRFMTLKHTVNKITSVAPVYRMITKAREMEKSERIIKFLEGKLSELQALEYGE